MGGRETPRLESFWEHKASLTDGLALQWVCLCLGRHGEPSVFFTHFKESARIIEASDSRCLKLLHTAVCTYIEGKKEGRKEGRKERKKERKKEREKERKRDTEKGAATYICII